GRLLGFSDVTRDCTARRLSDQERAESFTREQAARAEAEAALRTRDEFLSIASHELRSPVAVLQANAQLLMRWHKRGALDDERLEQSLVVLEKSAKRLTELTDDLLDVGRLRDGRLPLRLADMDVSDTLQRMVQEHQGQCTDSHTITLDLPSKPCHVTADAA